MRRSDFGLTPEKRLQRKDGVYENGRLLYMDSHFIDKPLAERIAKLCGTPVYVYDQATIERQADVLLSMPNAFGLSVGYAMKACSTRAILEVIRRKGITIDASSTWEAERALRAGFKPGEISLSAQELTEEGLRPLARLGIKINACSLSQIELIAKLGFEGEFGLRWNPGIGSGGTKKTNVGGPASSFGIWHEKLPEVQALVSRLGLNVKRIHSHIGSGADVKVWEKAAELTLRIAAVFPSVTHFNLGGGFKVARVSGEKATDVHAAGASIRDSILRFHANTGRKLHLEIEPGTFLLANAGAVLSRVADIVDTGEAGHVFVKLDTGMTDILRPSLYGSQHPIVVLPDSETHAGQVNCVVVGHCCESGDLLTPAPGINDELSERALSTPQIGAFAVIYGAGAYCSAMSSKNYNSFPESPEVLIGTDRNIQLIRSRQTLDQMLQNEHPLV